MANYQKIPNITGSGRDLLKNVPYVAPKPDSADKVPSNQKELVKTIQKLLDEAAKSQRLNKIMGDSRQADVILMRIASLLETLKLNQTSEELESAKKEILSKVESIAAEGFISKLVKEYLAKQIVDLFEQPATKDDIEDLKAYLAEVAESTRAGKEEASKEVESAKEGQTEEKSNAEEAQEQKAEDHEEGDYVDSTPAKNFFTVQTFIGQQFERLNATLAKMATPKVTPAMSRKQNKTMAIFERIGGAISKVFSFMKKVIKPAIDYIKNLIMKFVVIPITIIAAKILLIIAAITLIVAGAIILYQWVKKKIMEFVNYLTSGQMWQDIKNNALKAWEWLKDIGKTIWDAVLDAMKYIFVDIWVQLGKFIWDQLMKFWNWSYDNYIGPYIVEPVKKAWNAITEIWDEKIWPKIKPFVDSLTKLKETITKAFSAWDIDKSIWENLKNIGGLIKDGVIDWWNNSPFKTFYEENLKPFVDSAKELFKNLKNLGGYIKQAILDWWNGDSSLGETFMNIGVKVVDTIKEWWNKSVFKQYWSKITSFLDDITKPLRDWWNDSWMGRSFQTSWELVSSGVNKLSEWWDSFSIVDSIKEWYESTFLYQWISEIEQKGLWSFFADGLQSWYEGSWLKEFIDKIQNFGSAIADGIAEWWEGSALKRWIDMVSAKIEEIKQKLGKIVIKLPMMGYIRLFGPVVGLPMKVSDEDAKEIEKDAEYQKQLEKYNDLQKQLAEIQAGKKIKGFWGGDKTAERKAELEKQLKEMNFTPREEAQDKAKQVVSAQMEPLNELEKSRVEENKMVNESFASVAKARELEQKKQEDQQTWQSSQTYEMFQLMKDMRSEMKDGFANPNVVPAPVVITNSNGPNPAMMENR